MAICLITCLRICVATQLRPYVHIQAIANAYTKECRYIPALFNLSCIGVLWQCLAVCNRAMLRESCAYFVLASIRKVNGEIITDSTRGLERLKAVFFCFI
ncbi:hypothetical protein MKS83_15625 [Chryseobacterium sp. Y16C]|uniref:hypothetical protein n=1 Tax=Chryseobacterium sp. Y16C TaxID=2920939 RepID=UPI001F0B6D5D|nr:hypothetical protein [Chryseobacterium sp. Y16C]UMQ40820.1 hypothetical protein MKS83_15625 [Chryseobacterium sp. Y16C]